MLRKFFKWFLILALLAIITSIAGYLLLSPLAERFFRQELTKALKGKYTFTYSNFRVHIFYGSITLENAILTPTATISQPANPQRNEYKLQVGKLEIKGISYLALYKKSLEINSVEIQSPVVSIFNVVSEKSTSSEEFNFYELIKNRIQSLTVRKISLTNGQLILTKNDSSHIPKFTLNNFSMQMTQIYLDSAVATSNFGWPHWERMDLASDGNTYLLPDKRHRLEIPHLSWSDRDCVFVVANTRIFMDSTRSFKTFEIILPKMSAEKSDLRTLLSGNILLGAINVHKPQIYIQLQPKTTQIPRRNKVDINQMLRDNFPITQIASFNVQDGSVQIVNENKKYEVFLQGIHCNYGDIHINNPGIPDRIFEIPTGIVTIAQSRYVMTDSMFTIYAKNLTIAEGKDLNIQQLDLLPRYDKKKFSAYYGRHTEWMRFGIKNLSFNNTNVVAALLQGEIAADEVLIGHMSMAVFKNKVYKKNPHLHNLPARLLQEIDTKIHFKKIVLMGGEISYEELTPRRPGSSLLWFSKLHGTINNVTNLQQFVKAPMVCHLYGQMFGKGSVTLHLNFSLLKRDGEFKIRGHMGPMDMQLLNTVLKNGAMLSVKQGMADSLIFTLTANDSAAMGRMYFYYHDLKLEILQKRSFEKKGVKAHVGSFLLDKLLIKSENPEKRSKLRVGLIRYKRNPTKSFFNYLAKSVMSGFLASVAPAISEIKNKKNKK